MSMLPKEQLSGVSRTKQSMRQECDINHIVAKARKGQGVAHLARGVPMYADFSDVGDYKSALDRLRAADVYFAGLPAKVRAAFDNDPAKFLDGVQSPEGIKILEDAGLVEKGKPPVAVPPVEEPKA